MSRGPGIWQRQILDRIADGSVVILTGPDHTAAEQNAIRRAAARLEQLGKVQITSVRIDGTPRLIAAPPDMQIPQPRIVMGVNGKTYRLPF